MTKHTEVTHLGICVVVFSANPEAIMVNVSRLLEVLGSISSKLYLLINKIPESYNNIKNVNVVDIKGAMPYPLKGSIRSWMSILIWIFKNISVQARMSLALLKISRDVQIVIFSAGRPFILPLMLLAKTLRKKVILPAGGSTWRGYKATHPRASISLRLIKVLEQACYSISDNIAVESKSAVSFLELERFKDKISIYGALTYIDTNLFKTKTDLKDREDIIGFIGNLVSAKGVMKFVEAMPLIIAEHSNAEFVIIGDGPLSSEIRNKLENNNIQRKVKLTGLVPLNKIPDYLNDLRLLILPSDSEGLPGVILEAMACGTPVLATPVGAIPDTIKDGETGFILENNSPECIARNIMRALKHPGLTKITKKARGLIEQNYTYETVVDNYRQILFQLVEKVHDE